MTWRVGDARAHDHAERRDRAGDPRRRGRPGRLPRDGRRRSRCCWWPAWSAPTSAPGARRSARAAADRRACATSCGSWPRARDFRLLLTTFVLQALGDRRDAGRRRLRRAHVLGRQWRGDDPVRLLRRAGAAADAGVGGGRRPGRQEDAGTSPRRWSSPPARCCWSARGRRRRPWCSARPGWSASATPVRRCSRWRCCRTPPRSTPVAPGRTGPASSPASGPPGETLGLALGPGRLRAGAGAGRLRLLDHG